MPECRFIPTCVGNSWLPCAGTAAGPVHPHVCGELSRFVGRESHNHGSSPRVWGTPSAQAKSPSNARFIPTCVGNSDISYSKYQKEPVHPHVCGELLTKCQCSARFVGSSPRVWGTLLNPAGIKFDTRFIPTCVGNSFFVSQTSTPLSVHPHVCGELVILYGYFEKALGSSPRVWGTRSWSV